MPVGKRLVYSTKRPSYNSARYSSVQPAISLDTPAPKCLSFRDLLNSILGGGAGSAGGTGGVIDNGGCCSQNAGCEYSLQVDENTQTFDATLRGSCIALSSTPQTGKIWVVLQMSAFSTQGSSTPGFFFFLLRPNYTVSLAGPAGGAFAAGIPGTIMLGKGRAQGSVREYDIGSNAAANLGEFGGMDINYPFYLPSQWKIGAKQLTGTSTTNNITIRLLYYEIDCEQMPIGKLTPPTCGSAQGCFKGTGPTTGLVFGKG